MDKPSNEGCLRMNPLTDGILVVAQPCRNLANIDYTYRLFFMKLSRAKSRIVAAAFAFISRFSVFMSIRDIGLWTFVRLVADIIHSLDERTSPLVRTVSHCLVDLIDFIVSFFHPSVRSIPCGIVCIFAE